MILFFDTETTGKPINYKAPVTDLNNWPRIIQLAWALFNEDGTLFDKGCDLIKPNGWEIPKEEFWIKHGYSTEKSIQEGIEIEKALRLFKTPINRCDLMVAHNLDFDYPILAAEMIRAKISCEKKPQKFCTMKATVDFCQLPGPYGFKWPKLEKLHEKLFGVKFDGAHDALNDVMVTAACFFELRKRKVLSV